MKGFIHMKVKVLLIMPNKEVQIVKIPASIKFIKAFVGNELYKIKLNSKTVLMASKNSHIDEFNRFLFGNIILGTFLIVAIKNNRIVSLKNKDIRKYTNIFKLRKHQKKIEIYKEEYLEEYYSKQREIKQENAKKNKERIFKKVA